MASLVDWIFRHYLGRYRKRYEEILNSREADRSAIDRLQQQIAENEAQINLFRRRLGDLEDEARRYKAETQRLASEIARLQNEIQNETFVKSSLDTEKMALEDELAMLKQMRKLIWRRKRKKTSLNWIFMFRWSRSEWIAFEDGGGC